jgi:FKBP-type peptidyl-prolyl cis-trans isomerase
MKKGIIPFLVLLMIIAFGCGKSSEKNAEKGLDNEQASYAVGYDLGTRTGLADISGEIDVDVLVEGLKDALNNKEARISQEDREKILKQFQEDMREKQLKTKGEQGEKNKVEGKAFLEQHAKKEGAKITKSGLQYEIIREGTGPKPKATDKVKVHYRGTLIDGTEFDSSYKQGNPITLGLTGVIEGWREGVPLMKVGAKYRFVIPPELGYGENGAGPVIGPFAVLIFEIELIGIEPAESEYNKD